MCGTANGPELTRISVVDYNGIVVLDTLVKPYSPIVDYKEEFSGINAAMLDPVTVRLEQVQVALLSIATASTILVGHSLDNDLYSLKLSHKRCVDTAVIFAHPLGFPHRHKLKHLAKEYLKLNIQNASSNSSGMGHSSVEDARVALQLMKLKVEHGPLFGIKNHDQCPREPLVVKLPDSVKTAFFFSNEDLLKKRRACMGSGVHSESSHGSAAVVDNAIQYLQQVSNRKCLLRDQNFTYIEISCADYEQRSASKSLNSKAVNMESNAATASAGAAGEVQAVPAVDYYSHVERVKECLASHSNRDVLLLVSAQSSVQEVLDLQRRKRACASALSASTWSAELEESLDRRRHFGSLSEVEIVTVPCWQTRQQASK
jgi:DNA polymerase III epsilon subunit-like protein